MNTRIDILDRTWTRGPKRLKALQITLLFNNQEVMLEISSKSQIKELVKIHFYTLSKSTQYKLRCDLKKELKLNQKQCRHVIKINHKVQNMKMQNKELLN